jgi:hypothetical protein
MTAISNAAQALEFIRAHGVVLVSAKGSAPCLADAIAGAPIRGSWWSHPEGRRIFAILDAVRAHDDVLVCRLIDNKLTLVHRRLWPQLASIAGRIPAARLARVSETHTPSGRHSTSAAPFAEWVPAEVLAEAASTDPQQALATFGPWLAATTMRNT